jgi:hypothetical protein
MASSGKKKTTMGKLNRERRLRERRLDKQAKKDARKHASADQQDPTGDVTEPVGSGAGQPSLAPVAPLTDA